MHERVTFDPSTVADVDELIGPQVTMRNVRLMAGLPFTPPVFTSPFLARVPELGDLRGLNARLWSIAKQATAQGQRIEEQGLSEVAQRAAYKQAGDAAAAELRVSKIAESLASATAALAARRAALDVAALAPATTLRGLTIEGRMLDYARSVGDTRSLVDAISELDAGRADLARALCNSPSLFKLVNDEGRGVLMTGLREFAAPEEAEACDLVEEAVGIIAANLDALRSGLESVATGRLTGMPATR
jgi:hypothetical protein